MVLPVFSLYVWYRKQSQSGLNVGIFCEKEIEYKIMMCVHNLGPKITIGPKTNCNLK